MNRIIDIYFKIIKVLEKYCLPILLFYIRFWMAKIFWYSGLSKIDSWQSTLYLFKDMYKVPHIPPELAAYLTTSAELICPILLFFGIATRLAAIPMLIITAVIDLTYLDILEHDYWAMLLGIILLYGPGEISLDYIASKRIHK